MGKPRPEKLRDKGTTLPTQRPDYSATPWYGALVPAATPPETVAKLEAAIMDALKTPEVLAALKTFGSEPVGNSTPGTRRVGWDNKRPPERA